MPGRVVARPVRYRPVVPVLSVKQVSRAFVSIFGEELTKALHEGRVPGIRLNAAADAPAPAKRKKG